MEIIDIALYVLLGLCGVLAIIVLVGIFLAWSYNSLFETEEGDGIFGGGGFKANPEGREAREGTGGAERITVQEGRVDPATNLREAAAILGDGLDLTNEQWTEVLSKVVEELEFTTTTLVCLNQAIRELDLGKPIGDRLETIFLERGLIAKKIPGLQ